MVTLNRGGEGQVKVVKNVLEESKVTDDGWLGGWMDGWMN